MVLVRTLWHCIILYSIGAIILMIDHGRQVYYCKMSENIQQCIVVSRALIIYVLWADTDISFHLCSLRNIKPSAQSQNLSLTLLRANRQGMISVHINLKCQLHALYDQCTNPPIIVRLHNQGAIFHRVQNPVDDMDGITILYQKAKSFQKYPAWNRTPSIRDHHP